MNDNKTSKSGAIVKLIIWSVVLLILISLFATLMILNNGNAFGLKELPAIMTTYKYDFPEKYSAGDAVYTDEVKKLDIEWISGDVTVKVYDGDEVKLEESGAIDEDADKMRTYLGDGTLYVRYAKSGMRWFGSIFSKSLTLYLPEKYASALDKITLNAVSSDVKTEGDIVCREFRFEGVSGKISMPSLSCDTVDIDTVSGNVTISGKIGKIDVDAVSSNLTLRLSDAPRNVDMSTVSGRVDMTIPEDCGFSADLDSVSGVIRINSQNVGKSHVRGDGASIFDFESVSGDVRITLE